MSAFEADDPAALVDIPGIASLDTFLHEDLQAFSFNALNENPGLQTHVRSASATSSTDHALAEDALPSDDLRTALFLPSGADDLISWPSSDQLTDSPGGSPRYMAGIEAGSSLAAAGSGDLTSEPQDAGVTAASDPVASAAQPQKGRERRRRQQTTFTTSKLAKQREKNRRCQRSFRERQKVKQSAIMQELSDLRERNAYLEAQLALHTKS